VVDNISRGSHHKLGLGRLTLDGRTSLFTVVEQQGKRLAGKAVECPSLKVFETQSARAITHQISSW